jgi:parallel beta-helix repeat protein
LSAEGSLFTVENGVTLKLDNNVTLQGWSYSGAPLVLVNSRAALIMNSGAIIRDNSASSGGGVYVASGGIFTMSGGEISNNTASSSGGGVYVANAGTFTMSGGEISGNTTTSGGGVYVLDGGIFTMSGGEISNNTASSSGGGVYVADGGAFTMSDGGISGNTAGSSGGGGVYVSCISVNSSHRSDYFTKSGGTIYGNIVSGGAALNIRGRSVFYDVSYKDSYGFNYNAYYYCNDTLDEDDDISTDDTLPSASGQPVGKWTRQ